MAPTMPTGTPAKRTTLLALLAAFGLIFLSAEAQAWQTNISGTAGGGVFNATAVDGDGNVVAAGYITNTDTGNDFIVVKFDGASGAELWRQVVRGNDRGSSNGVAYAVAVDGVGNVLAAGSIYEVSYPGRFTVVKLDGANGAELWRIVFGEEGGSGAYSVAVDGVGNVAAAGTNVRSPGGPVFSVNKVDGTSGEVLWHRDIDDVGASEYAYAVAVDGAGDVVAGGKFAGPQFTVIKFDGAGGAELWRQVIQGGVANAVAIDAAGNVAAAGFINNPPPAAMDFTVVKVDGASGVELWRGTLPGYYFTGADQATAIAVDGTGNVAAAGVIVPDDDTSDFAVAKFSGADGTELWRRSITGTGHPNYDRGNAVATDGAGNVIAAGVTMNLHRTPGGTFQSHQDFTVIKFDGTSGVTQWQNIITPLTDCCTNGSARAVKVDGAGDIVAAGTVSNAATVAKFRGADGGDFTPPDTEPPTVTITSPENLALISGTVTVSADASDNVGVVGVQFQLDGAQLDAEDTEAPYAVTWDSSTATIGQHVLTAVARDAAGNASTAAPVTVTVVNVPRIGILP